MESASKTEKFSVEKHASLVSILDTILNANIPLVGISVLEVLNTLFTHLIKSVQDGHSFSEQEPTDLPGKLEYAIQRGLVHSIGGLASQTYYLNQLNDITGYIISKLRVGNTTLETIEGLPVQEYRRVVLKCLNLVTVSSSTTAQEQNQEPDSNNENAPIYGNAVTLDAWVPALGLLLDKTPGK